MKHRSRQWFIALLCLGYAAALLAYAAVRTLASNGQPVMALLGAFQPFLFAPLLVALPMSFLSRSRIAVLGSLLGLSLFVWYYGALFLPRTYVSAAAASASIRVMTFNVGLGRATPQQIATAIKNEHADIVAVQELLPSSLVAVEAELAEEYPYVDLAPSPETTALFSRYPIVQSQWLQPSRSGRAFLQARIDWEAQAVTFFVVHPYPAGITWLGNSRLPTGLLDASPQGTAIDVAQRAAAVPGTVIVAGDFNLSEQTPAYTTLRSQLKDAYREAGHGFGFTFPVKARIGSFALPGPFVRIDYIFHSHDLAATQATIGCANGSDHCYLVAQLLRNH